MSLHNHRSLSALAACQLCNPPAPLDNPKGTTPMSTETASAATTHETTVEFSPERSVVRWVCTCGERGQRYKARHESTVRLSAVYHERNNETSA